MRAKASVSARKASLRIDSRHRVQDAFIELLSERPFSKIHVSDVVSRAGVSHTTYYRQFYALEDIASSILDEVFEEVGRRVPPADASIDDRTAEDRIRWILQVYRDNARTLKTLLDSDLHPQVVDRTFLFILATTVAGTASPDAWPIDSSNSRIVEMYRNYSSAGMTQVTISWLRNGCVDPLGDICDFILQMRGAIMDRTGFETIYLAGGCFWGVEEMFRQIPGVVSTQVGYANGTGEADATYKRVCEGGTGFKETVRVRFDPRVITLEKLLWAYFHIIDLTIENRQGNDIGEQYQTGIYWDSSDAALGAEVKRIADAERARIEANGRPFRVEVHTLSNFFGAEEYHQYYLVKNPNGYCHVSRAEMAEVLKELA